MAMNGGLTISMIQIFERFSDVETARIYLEDRRWCGASTCPHCGCGGNIVARRGKLPGCHYRRDFGRGFTVRAGTTLERSQIPLPSEAARR